MTVNKNERSTKPSTASAYYHIYRQTRKLIVSKEQIDSKEMFTEYIFPINSWTDFQVRSGANVLICGPNGCGKSSLFRVLGEVSTNWPQDIVVLFCHTIYYMVKFIIAPLPLPFPFIVMASFWRTSN